MQHYPYSLRMQTCVPETAGRGAQCRRPAAAVCAV